MSATRWLPLESNPEVMNKYAKALGMPGGWQFTDIWGLDAEMLSMVPRPVLAVLLLYPLTEKTGSQQIGTEEANADMYFIKQTIGNACGTIGLIHAILNNAEKMNIPADAHLMKFLLGTKDLSSVEKAKYLEDDKAFGDAHEASAQEGQTEAPSRDDHVKCHFVAFVNKDGNLYELDGRQSAPVNHGKSSPDTLLEDAAAVVKKFMARDPDELNFTLVALTQA